MLFLIGVSLLFALCVLATVVLVGKLMRLTYEKRFKKNIKRHLDELPKKKESEPLPFEHNNILSFSLLERFYRSQRLGLPYKMEYTEAYVESLQPPPPHAVGKQAGGGGGSPVAAAVPPPPPTYEEIDLTGPTPVVITMERPPTYAYDLEHGAAKTTASS